VIGLGYTTTAIAAGKDQKGNPFPTGPIIWTTSKSSVATVSENGLVTAVAFGEAVISARDGVTQGGAKVTVGATPVATVEVIAIGSASQVVTDARLVAAVPKGGKGETLVGRSASWTTSDASVATVAAVPGTSDAMVTILKPGTVKISATSEGVTGSADITGVPFTFKSVAAGGNFSCGVTPHGGAFCWGENGVGKLGDNTTTSRLTLGKVMEPAGILPRLYRELWAGENAACAVNDPGQLYCWGLNNFGQLGTGRTTNELRAVGTFGSILGFGIGRFHTCAVIPFLWCSGENGGKLGNGGTANSSVPVHAPTPDKFFSSVAAGAAHTCALRQFIGEAYCWGDNSFGQLGDGTTTARSTPTAVSGGLTFTAITAAGDHTCGVVSGGAVYCWGNNASGQLGDGTQDNRPAPVAVQGGLAFAKISAGSAHTCGLTSGGTAYCWGSSLDGQVGDGTSGIRLAPTAVSGGLTFTGISAGLSHTCGAVAGGAAYCWGNNSTGALGDGTTTARLVPVAVRRP
jgi:alpha-tubulin suppressor-like RCC1 family protein